MNKRVKVIVPFPFDEKGIANRRSQLPDALIRSGFEAEFVPVKNSCAYADSYYDTMLLDMFIFETGLKAEEEGYAAVCIDTVSDSGLYALRSRLTIPVLGPGQVAFHLERTSPGASHQSGLGDVQTMRSLSRTGTHTQQACLSCSPGA